MTAALKVLEAGPSSTFQDRGRFGFLRYGVAPAGPCDALLHAIANRLVGNNVGAAAIEFTLKGDRYEVIAETTRVAVVGDVTVEIDGQIVSSWRSHTLQQGQTLSVGYLKAGVRGYLAVDGGFDLLPELGSCSTHVRSGIGPLGGGRITGDTTIPIKLGNASMRPEQKFDVSALPLPSTELRVLLGPQDQYFAPDDLDRFTTQDGFVLTPKSDRMGAQLSGPNINYRRDLPLISEGMPLGSVQVLSEGNFVVALVDRQTVGGYPKIATIIGPDIRKLTQARPGSVIRFRAVDIAEAQKASRDYSTFVARLDNHIKPIEHAKPIEHGLRSEALLSTNLISGVYSD